jgi:fructose-bisphosphate aldolase/2-amino-3,7-dideoxy-D-threo-hept-6-ulosonate synthase
MAGKELRLRRIFAADSRTLIVAMDHAAPMGPIPGLEDPAPVIGLCVSAGADAVLTTFGTATRSAEALDGRGLILRLIEGEGLGVEDALRIGADAVMSMYFVGQGQRETARHTGELSSACNAWGVPLTVEVLPRVEGADASETPWVIARGSRAAFEAGADMIKTMYTGDPESFARVVQGSHLPIVVLGGPRSGSDRELMHTVREALDAGARGAAVGRNIWQHERPQRMVAALARLIHEDASVEQAERELNVAVPAGRPADGRG